MYILIIISLFILLALAINRLKVTLINKQYNKLMDDLLGNKSLFKIKKLNKKNNKKEYNECKTLLDTILNERFDLIDLELSKIKNVHNNNLAKCLSHLNVNKKIVNNKEIKHLYINLHHLIKYLNNNNIEDSKIILAFLLLTLNSQNNDEKIFCCIKLLIQKIHNCFKFKYELLLFLDKIITLTNSNFYINQFPYLLIGSAKEANSNINSILPNTDETFFKERLLHYYDIKDYIYFEIKTYFLNSICFTKREKRVILNKINKMF